MTTLDQKFEQYYTRFYNEIVKPLEVQCEKRNFVNLGDFIHLLPPPTFYLSAMPRMKVLCQKENLKESFIEWAGPCLSKEEKEYIDTLEFGLLTVARVKTWMDVFKILLKDY